MFKFSLFKSEFSFFMPGAVLLAVGIAMLAAPKLFVYLIAGVLVFAGLALISLAAKFLVYKERFARSFSAKVVLHPGHNPHQESSTTDESSEIKKVILH